MAGARKVRNQGRARQGGGGRGLPGWAMLTIGLIIGLFIAFLVYLDDIDAPPATAVERTDDPAGDPDTPQASDDRDDEPRFEFYSILPELEVVVPDGPTGPAHEGDPAAGGTGPASGDGATPDRVDGTETATAAPAAGTYYLQAGSFQKSHQADEMKARIALIGLDVAIQTVDISGQRWHRVRIGPYSESDTLHRAQQRLREHEIDYLVLRDKSGD